VELCWVGFTVGGPSLSAKCIIVAALAAAQSAYFLAQVRYILLSILSSLSIEIGFLTQAEGVLARFLAFSAMDSLHSPSKLRLPAELSGVEI